MCLYLFAEAALESPVGRWAHFAPHRRSSHPQEEEREAEDLGPPPAEPLFHHSLPVHLLCFLPQPPRGLSVPANISAAGRSECNNTHHKQNFLKGSHEQRPSCVHLSYGWDVWLIWSTMVVGHKGM